MKNLDARKVPPYEKYDENSGQDLGKYLIQFEKYCEISFREERNWIGARERHLTGKFFGKESQRRSKELMTHMTN